jgi:hypothetical protein
MRHRFPSADVRASFRFAVNTTNAQNDLMKDAEQPGIQVTSAVRYFQTWAHGAEHRPAYTTAGGRH